jgi:multiple sugar transport system permease protein
MARERRKVLTKGETLKGYLFVAPTLIGLAFFSYIPVLMSAILSFTSWDMISGFGNIRFRGIGNYAELLRDSVFWVSLLNNLLFGVITIPLLLVLGFILAVLIDKYCFAKKLFKLVYFLPYISSIIAVASVWRFLFFPSFGPVNEALKALGVLNPPKWLADTTWALPSLAFMYVWQNMSYDMIIFLAGLQVVPRELYEAADIDGANGLQKMRSITLPMITPTVFFLLIAEIMASFRIFDQIQYLTEGGPGISTSVLVYYLYRVSFKYYRFGYGYTISLILFAIVFGITYFYWKGRKRWVESYA